MASQKTPVETGAINHPNVKAIRNYQAAMANGDLENALTVFDPEVTYTVPGNNLLSGIYKGPQEVMSYLGRLMQLTGGSYRISEMHWLVNEKEQVILFINNHADLNGRFYEWEETILFEFKNGKKYNIEHFQADQLGMDEFLRK
ncbi:MAG: nuclear transport factor 2 family protein [Ferruginibacter sp.]|nr:nuclear transport factor 2 family protein [Ferruginibacter sp.]